MRMKKNDKLISLLLALVMVLSLLPMGAFAAGGTITGAGTESDPYIISDAADLAALATNVSGGNSYSGQYIKVADTYSDTTAVTSPIGVSSSAPFAGTFDGNGKTINVNLSGSSRVGLFGYVTGTVKNVTVTGTVTGSSMYCGGVVAYLNGGSVLNCANKANVTGSGGYSGGVVGYTNGTVTIDGCYNSGTVSGGTRLGGIVGEQYTNVAVSNCYNVGTISGSSSSTGGVVGYGRGPVTNCYHAVGTVTSSSSGASVGAIVGYMYSSGSASNCYYVVTNDGLQGNSAGSIGTSMSVTEMQGAAASLGASYMADSGNINGGYPVLYWQGGGEAPDTTIVDELDYLMEENAAYLVVKASENASSALTSPIGLDVNSVYLDSFSYTDYEFPDDNASIADVTTVWTSSDPGVITVPNAGYGAATVNHSTSADEDVTLTAYLTAVVDGVTYTSSSSVQYTFTVAQDVGETTSMTVYVSVFNGEKDTSSSPTASAVTGTGGRLMYAVPVTVTAPANTICVSDALQVVHDQYCGADTYTVGSSGMITEFWGEATSNVGIYRNDVLTDAVTVEPISEGDTITIFKYNSSSYSDKYMYFSAPVTTLNSGGAVSLALNSKTQTSASSEAVESAVVSLYELGEDGGITASSITASMTGSTVSATFPSTAKTYVMVAHKYHTGISAYFGARMVPAVCLIKVGDSNQNLVDDDAAALRVNGQDNTDTIDVISYVDLPTVGGNGSLITWESSNEAVITDSGNVIRPDSAATVTLTANLNKNGATATKAFTVSVAARTAASSYTTVMTGLLGDLRPTTLTEDNLWAAMDVAAYATFAPTYALTDAERLSYYNSLVTFIDGVVNSSDSAAQKSSDLAKAIIILKAVNYSNGTGGYSVNNISITNDATGTADTPMNYMISYYDTALAAAQAAVADGDTEAVTNYLPTASFVLMAILEEDLDATETKRDTIRDLLLTAQDSDGSWSTYLDIDAVVITGLGMYYKQHTNASVLSALTNSTTYLKARQLGNGAFPATVGDTVANADTTAFVVIGLAAADANPAGADFTQTNGRSAIDGLLTFYNSTTDMFQYNGVDNAMATEQSLRALVAAYGRIEGSGIRYIVYDFAS